MSISLKNISKIYGEQFALNDISFEAKEGEILGLLGPNGAGKTTTMKILSCFMPASSGDASVYGFDVKTDALEIKKILGYLPEHNPLYGNMYVKEYLNFVAKIHKISNASSRIDELIELTGLEREYKKTISSLSKGYKQRVGIAQSIIHKPKVLILDEPISGLDPNQIIEIRKLISSFRNDMTVIFSSHILHEVEAVCDRVVILDKGKIVADENIENLNTKSDSRNEILIEFLNDIDQKVFDLIEVDFSLEKINSRKYILSASAEHDIRESLFDICVKQNNKILELRSKQIGLENVFKSLTKTEQDA